MSDHARCPSGVALARFTLEVADILRRHLDGYRQSHDLTLGQERAVRALLACRTAALGAGGGAGVFWGSTRNFPAPWPIETYAQTAATRP
jgi:hypothetical protein